MHLILIYLFISLIFFITVSQFWYRTSTNGEQNVHLDFEGVFLGTGKRTWLKTFTLINGQSVFRALEMV